MIKHTPGPWEISTAKIVWWEIRAADGSCVLGFYDSEGEVPNEANARLLIAAPEMLRILRQIDVEELTRGLEVGDELRALLNKIDGEI